MLSIQIYLNQNLNMYNFLFSAHNIIRYILLVALVLALLNAFLKDRNKRSFSSVDNIINRTALGFLHLQFLFGLLLYTHSPKVNFDAGFMKNPIIRYYTVEHIFIMLIAVVLFTIGVARTKRLPETKKHRSVWLFGLIAVALISIGLLTLK